MGISVIILRFGNGCCFEHGGILHLPGFCVQAYEHLEAGGAVQLCRDPLMGHVLSARGAWENPSRRKHHLLLSEHFPGNAAWGELLVRQTSQWKTCISGTVVSTEVDVIHFNDVFAWLGFFSAKVKGTLNPITFQPYPSSRMFSRRRRPSAKSIWTFLMVSLHV